MWVGFWTERGKGYVGPDQIMGLKEDPTLKSWYGFETSSGKTRVGF